MLPEETYYRPIPAITSSSSSSSSSSTTEAPSITDLASSTGSGIIATTIIQIISPTSSDANPSPTSTSTPQPLTLGLGLGLSIPLGLALIALSWFIWRRRSKQSEDFNGERQGGFFAKLFGKRGYSRANHHPAELPAEVPVEKDATQSQVYFIPTYSSPHANVTQELEGLQSSPGSVRAAGPSPMPPYPTKPYAMYNATSLQTHTPSPNPSQAHRYSFSDSGHNRGNSAPV